MLKIPLRPLQNQIVTVTLSQQPCRINVYQKSTGLFFDLFNNDVAVVSGVLCLDAVKMVRDSATGFIGDFAFFDKQGTSAPDWTGVGDRWILIYLEAGDLD